MVEYSSALLYVACTVLDGKNLVNSLCTDNSSEWRGSLHGDRVGYNESFIFKVARESPNFCLQSPVIVQHQLENRKSLSISCASSEKCPTSSASLPYYSVCMIVHGEHLEWPIVQLYNLSY